MNKLYNQVSGNIVGYIGFITNNMANYLIAMHVQKILQCFQHAVPARKQDSPYRVPPRKYGTAAHDLLPEDTLDKINEKRVKIIQQVIGGVLYYAQAVDLTVLAAHSSIVSEQASAAEDAEKRVSQLLDYLATHPYVKGG